MKLCRHDGFTLIELMVVLVIIGVMVSFAVLSIGDGGRHDRLLEEGNRLAALVKLANDQAVLEGREWGLRIEPDGYRFMVLKDGRWHDADDDHMFRPRQMTDGFSLSLRMDDVTISLTPPDKEEENASDKPQESPQVFLMSSAERTPFEVVIAAAGGKPAMVVEAPEMGKVVVHDKVQP